ncbi:hypothetical protein GAO09_25175 [Rhizobiales bacterium RZME27]|uniref:Uncharacterized protein n=1 Tax=Endobacterium cereale TaxID=2663029 RepID=A0A6A8AEZ9_9HYPH|nr:hypothetical protein [Endobacterium cereale]MEB2847485.1 hypothetical protein [Endobacterium cereale]MQY49334.1 hypothetical protein [Endobacterium cereale]
MTFADRRCSHHLVAAKVPKQCLSRDAQNISADISSLQIDGNAELNATLIASGYKSIERFAPAS